MNMEVHCVLQSPQPSQKFAWDCRELDKRVRLASSLYQPGTPA
jgi:hypothetical protein